MAWRKRRRQYVEESSYWPAYVPVAERQEKARQKVAALKKSGKNLSPIVISGRKIASSFWGKGWCDHLESFSDYSNRLPRGRSYVRNGLVVDLAIETGRVKALVSGTSLYKIDIQIEPLSSIRWRKIVEACTGRIDSVLELLESRLSDSVMKIMSDPKEGLFPAPREIKLSCSCPDWATMCKHVAASLYGIGARLDAEPHLLFTLRGVDEKDLIAHASANVSLGTVPAAGSGSGLDHENLGGLFGIDMATENIDVAAPDVLPAAHPPKARRAIRISTGEGTAPDVRPAARSSKSGGNGKKATRRTAPVTRMEPRPSKTWRRGRKVTTRDLLDRGIPRTTFQNWVVSGVLIRTDERGVYRTTKDTEDRIRRSLAS